MTWLSHLNLESNSNLCDSVKQLALPQWRIQRERSPPLKLAKVSFFTINLQNLENTISDVRTFYHPVFCHSSAFISFTVARLLRLDYQIILKSPRKPY